MRLQTQEQKKAEKIYREKVLEQRLGSKIFNSNYKYGNIDFYITNWVLPQIYKFKEIINKKLEEKIKNGTILELGSESGHISSFIHNNFNAKIVIASDIASSLNKALPFIAAQLGFKKHPEAVILDNHFLPFKDNSLDIIFGFSVLHHVPSPYHILKEVKRVIKKDGLVMFCGEPFLPRYLLGLQFLYSRFDKKQGICEKVFTLKDWFSFINGFKIVALQFEPPSIFKKFLSSSPFICKYLTGGGLDFILKRTD